MRCTYCGGSDFYEGPSGGMSTNILCVNKNCRHWFNYMGGDFPFEDLHKIEPMDEEKEEVERVKQKERDEWPEKIMNEGREIYKTGKGPIDCAKDSGATTYTSLIRLCGFIEAMLCDFRQSESLKRIKE